MIGKLLAGMVGARLAGKDHQTAGALAAIGIEVVAKRLVPLVIVAGAAAYAYKLVRDAIEEEFGGEDRDYPSEASPSPPSG